MKWSPFHVHSTQKWYTDGETKDFETTEFESKDFESTEYDNVDFDTTEFESKRL